MPFTDTFTKRSGKAVGNKHSDGGGLFLHVKSAGKYEGTSDVGSLQSRRASCAGTIPHKMRNDEWRAASILPLPSQRDLRSILNRP